MDAELERWKSDGQYFDYLGFDVFYRKRGQRSHPAAHPRLPVQFVGLGADMGQADRSLHGDRARHARHGVLRQARQVRVHGARPRRHARGAARHLGVESAHILAHDIGDSVGQEMLARHEFAEQAYGGLRIESITWLNGGLFNEAYTPRLLQKVLSRTPLGDLLSPLQASPLSRRLIEPTINELFGSGHQTVAPDARPVPRDPRVQRRQAGDAQGRQVRQRPLRASQSVGPGDAANRHPDAADRRARRPELGQAHGAALPRGHSRTRTS